MTVRRVTHLPLEEVWSENGQVVRERLRDLSQHDIKELLAAGPVQFVVADVGHVLKWVTLEQRFTFCKDEVQPHLLSPEALQRGTQLDLALDGYGYEASQWRWSDGALVLLAKWH